MERPLLEFNGMWEYDKFWVVLITVLALVVAGVICYLLYTFQWEVDERAVIFSADGTPHCPYCYRIVRPHQDVCPYKHEEPEEGDCGHRFRWVSRETVCWFCGGTGHCPECRGTGLIFTYEYKPQPVNPCKTCEEGVYGYAGRGKCPVCGGLGWIEHGNSIIPTPNITRRKHLENRVRVLAEEEEARRLAAEGEGAEEEGGEEESEPEE